MNNLYYMKRNFIIILFLFFVSHSFAQQSPPQRFSPKEFMKDMENFISQEAGLTPMEAASFFPVFEEMCAKQRAVFDRVRQIGRNKPADENGCLKAIQLRDKLDLEQKKIEQYYHNKFLKVLSASKVYDVIKAEDKYHRHMFKRMAQMNWCMPHHK
jgi:hypothetical protein